MAEIVRNGIEKASEDLRKESENQSVQKVSFFFLLKYDFSALIFMLSKQFERALFVKYHL